MNANKYCGMHQKLLYPDRAMKKDDPVRYERLLAAYQKGNKEIYGLFKKEALEEVGLTEHPKKDEIFGYAWMKGHSSGYGDVFCELQDVAELLKKIEV